MKAALLKEIAEPPIETVEVIPRSDLGCHFWVLHALVIALRAKQVIELGVRRGVSTVALLSALDVTDGRLWSCDREKPPVPPFVHEHSRWDFCLGEDLEVASSAPDVCDLLFIDTSHELAHTKAELELYASRVKEGGIIALHDTVLTGVSRPARAWAKAHGTTFVNLPGSNGLGVIYA